MTLIRAAIAALAALAVIAVGNSSVRAESYGYIPDTKIYLGGGFDPLFPQRNFPLCVAAKNECQTSALNSIACLTAAENSAGGVRPTPPYLGNTTQFSIRQIKSKFEFFQEINVSVSLSGSYGPFSASGSFSSYSMDEITEDSLTFMVLAKGYYGSFGLADPKLAQSLSSLTPTNLIGRCGTEYVSQVDRGVVAAALFSVYNLDEKHKREIHASLSAGFSAGFSAEANATFSSIIRTAVQYGSMSIRVFTIGGGGSPALSALIEKNPTDLDGVKTILKTYVEQQDPSKAAIIGFHTTGFGKLTNQPSIDPDHSSYLHFLEGGNTYRLKLLDSLTKTNGLLERQSDFDPATIKKAKRLANKLQCEIRYTENALQACRISVDFTRSILTDGQSGNDRSALIGLAFGLPTNINVGRVKICESATRKPTASSTNAQFLALGWKRSQVALDVAAADDALTDDQAKEQCETRQSKFDAPIRDMLKSGLERRGPSSKGASSADSVCIAGCDIDEDFELLSQARLLPQLPFQITYWFDQSSGGFGSQNRPGFYLALREAAKVRQVRFYREVPPAQAGAQKEAFAVRNNNNTSAFVMFIPLQSIASDTNAITVEFDTINNNTYSFSFPRLKVLAN
jgi:hypothetical protein